MTMIVLFAALAIGNGYIAVSALLTGAWFTATFCGLLTVLLTLVAVHEVRELRASGTREGE